MNRSIGSRCRCHSSELRRIPSVRRKPVNSRSSSRFDGVILAIGVSAFCIRVAYSRAIRHSRGARNHRSCAHPNRSPCRAPSSSTSNCAVIRDRALQSWRFRNVRCQGSRDNPPPSRKSRLRHLPKEPRMRHIDLHCSESQNLTGYPHRSRTCKPKHAADRDARSNPAIRPTIPVSDMEGRQSDRC